MTEFYSGPVPEVDITYARYEPYTGTYYSPSMQSAPSHIGVAELIVLVYVLQIDLAVLPGCGGQRQDVRPPHADEWRRHDSAKQRRGKSGWFVLSVEFRARTGYTEGNHDRDLGNGGGGGAGGVGGGGGGGEGEGGGGRGRGGSGPGL